MASKKVANSLSPWRRKVEATLFDKRRQSMDQRNKNSLSKQDPAYPTEGSIVVYKKFRIERDLTFPPLIVLLEWTRGRVYSTLGDDVKEQYAVFKVSTCNFIKLLPERARVDYVPRNELSLDDCSSFHVKVQALGEVGRGVGASILYRVSIRSLRLQLNFVREGAKNCWSRLPGWDSRLLRLNHSELLRSSRNSSSSKTAVYGVTVIKHREEGSRNRISHDGNCVKTTPVRLTSVVRCFPSCRKLWLARRQ